MNDDTLFLATGLLLLLAIAGALACWYRASARADRAEDGRHRAERRAYHSAMDNRRYQAALTEALADARRYESAFVRANGDARRYRRDAINARGRLAKYLTSEEAHFSTIPRDTPTVELPTDLPDQLDQFLDDLLRGNS